MANWYSFYRSSHKLIPHTQFSVRWRLTNFQIFVPVSLKVPGDFNFSSLLHFCLVLHSNSHLKIKIGIFKIFIVHSFFNSLVAYTVKIDIFVLFDFQTITCKIKISILRMFNVDLISTPYWDVLLKLKHNGMSAKNKNSWPNFTKI